MSGKGVRPVLVFAWGNPSRGDDALGPAFLERLDSDQRTGELDHVELLTDFQLQVEHAQDLQGRERVLFVDASVSAQSPCELHLLQPERDASYTTHAMSPGAVLAVYEQINRCPPPPAWLLSIRGYEFGLGLEMSAQARKNLSASYKLALDFLK